MSLRSGREGAFEARILSGELDDVIDNLMKTPTMYLSLTPSRSLKSSLIDVDELADVTKSQGGAFQEATQTAETLDIAGLDVYLNELVQPGEACASLVFRCCVCSQTLDSSAGEGELILSTCGHVAHRSCGLPLAESSELLARQASERTQKLLPRLGVEHAWQEFVVNCDACGNHLALSQYNLPFHSKLIDKLLEHDENSVLRNLMEKNSKIAEYVEVFKSELHSHIPGALQHVQLEDGHYSTYFTISVDPNDPAFKTSTQFNQNDQLKVKEGTFVRVKSHTPVTVEPQSALHNFVCTLTLHQRSSSRRALQLEKQCNEQSIEANINVSRTRLQQQYREYQSTGRAEGEQKRLKRLQVQNNDELEKQWHREMHGVALSQYEEINQVYGQFLLCNIDTNSDKDTSLRAIIAEDAGIVVRSGNDSLVLNAVLGLSAELPDLVPSDIKVLPKKQDNPFIVRQVSGIPVTRNSSVSHLPCNNNSWLKQQHSICMPEPGHVASNVFIDPITKEQKLEVNKKKFSILLSNSKGSEAQSIGANNQVLGVNGLQNLLKGRKHDDSRNVLVSPGKNTVNASSSTSSSNNSTNYYDLYNELDLISQDKVYQQIRSEEADFLRLVQQYSACLEDTRRQFGIRSQEHQEQLQKQDDQESRDRDVVLTDELHELKRRKLALENESKQHKAQQDVYIEKICEILIEEGGEAVRNGDLFKAPQNVTPQKPSALSRIKLLAKANPVKPTNLAVTSNLSSIASKVIQNKLKR